VLFHRVGAPGLFDEAAAICCRAGFSPEVRHEPDLMTTVFIMVECGPGASLVPGCARGFERQKTIRRPLVVPSNPCLFVPPGCVDRTVRPVTHFWIFCAPTSQSSRNTWPIHVRHNQSLVSPENSGSLVNQIAGHRRVLDGLIAGVQCQLSSTLFTR
jgi:hypothetical protein